MDEKYKLLGNFEKILKFFDKNSLENFTFYLFLEKLLLKIAFENNIIFLQHFFNFGGGTFPVPPPSWRRLWQGMTKDNFQQWKCVTLIWLKRQRCHKRWIWLFAILKLMTKQSKTAQLTNLFVEWHLISDYQLWLIFVENLVSFQ